MALTSLGSGRNGANLREVWGEISVSRRLHWIKDLDADRARRIYVSMGWYRRFSGGPQLVDVLPNDP
jgi:hypothetical protein